MAETRKEPVRTPDPAGERTVRIRIPTDRKDNSPVFVSVNDRTWLIRRGESVDVPECVAEVLRHAEEAENEQYAYRERIGAR